MKKYKIDKDYENSLEEFGFIELKAKRSIFSTIFIFLIKIIFSICIIFLAFLEKIFTVIEVIVNFAAFVLFLIGLIGSAFVIHEKGFDFSELWVPILISFIGFILPFAGTVILTILEVIKPLMSRFVFGSLFDTNNSASKVDE